MSATDPGLPDAVQRVMDALSDLTVHGATVAATAARSDVPDLIRQAKADALEDFAHQHVRNQSPGRMAEDLLEHAAAIRAGRQ